MRRRKGETLNECGKRGNCDTTTRQLGTTLVGSEVRNIFKMSDSSR